MSDLEIINREPEAEARPNPIVFVHGAWHGAWCWQEFFVPFFLDQGYRCVAFSLRGHGRSEGRLFGAGIRSYVRDLAQVTAGLDAPPIIIAHSMGGFTTQKYLEKYKAAAVVLLASVPPSGVLGTSLRIMLRHPWAFIKANLSLRLKPIIGAPALAREAFFAADMPADQFDRYFAQLQDESYLAFLGMLLLRPKPKLDDTPVLVLGAADDTIFTQKEVDKTARTYGTEATIFQSMAHDMMLEAGWEAVAGRINDWLGQQGF